MNILWQKIIRIQAIVLVIAWIISWVTGDPQLATVGFWVGAEAMVMLAIGGTTGLGGFTSNRMDFNNHNRTLVTHQITGGLPFYKDIRRSALSFQIVMVLNAIIAFVLGFLLAFIAG